MSRPKKSSPHVKKLTKADYRRYENGQPERQIKFTELVEYARSIRRISNKYLPKNKQKRS